jgi:prepilin-type N-terminal cleavage/methylation domain-containing protein
MLRCAFTLIELLVVVTIIVVLLALLTPALDKAIYQAELAVCGAHLRTIATGATQYAFASRKHYPDRPSRTSNGSNRPTDVYWGQNEQKDDRTILKTFLNVNENLNDPLIRPIDVAGSRTDSVLVVPYALYFGWGYDKAGKGDKIMRRIGDRWTYTEEGDGSVPAVVESFSVLASDWDGLLRNASRNQSSHPDRDGTMENFTIQDEIFTGVLVPRPFTFTVWRTPPSLTRRGPIDTNYAFDDGSVGRYTDVPWDAAEVGAASDHGLVLVPQADSQNTAPSTMLRVPRR